MAHNLTLAKLKKFKSQMLKNAENFYSRASKIKLDRYLDSESIEPIRQIKELINSDRFTRYIEKFFTLCDVNFYYSRGLKNMEIIWKEDCITKQLPGYFDEELPFLFSPLCFKGAELIFNKDLYLDESYNDFFRVSHSIFVKGNMHMKGFLALRQDYQYPATIIVKQNLIIDKGPVIVCNDDVVGFNLLVVRGNVYIPRKGFYIAFFDGGEWEYVGCKNVKGKVSKFPAIGGYGENTAIPLPNKYLTDCRTKEYIKNYLGLKPDKEVFIYNGKISNCL